MLSYLNNMLKKMDIGIKNTDGGQIILDDLMSNHYLKVSSQVYGLYILANEILKRNKFEWFAR